MSVLSPCRLRHERLRPQPTRATSAFTGEQRGDGLERGVRRGDRRPLRGAGVQAGENSKISPVAAARYHRRGCPSRRRNGCLAVRAVVPVVRRTCETVRPGTTGDVRSHGERLECGLFRDDIQFCSGLVDLVVRVVRHGGGRHRLALAGERLVGRLTEHIAEVSNRGAELCHDGKCSERA